MTPPETQDVSLQGVGVLVTRAAHQAGPLQALIEAAAGTVISFPAIHIEAVSDPAPAQARFRQLAHYDIVVFVSANAVEWAFRTGLEPVAMAGCRLAAIGRATADALQGHGLEVSIRPQQRFDSEGLLAEAALQQVDGQHILIVRGVGGRQQLATVLRERGAEVVYAEVYRRGRPEADSTALLDDWQAGRIQVVTASSREVLDNLWHMLPEAGQQWLRETPLVVIGERTAALARTLGFKHTALIAEPASDAGIVQALKQWRQQTYQA